MGQDGGQSESKDGVIVSTDSKMMILSRGSDAMVDAMTS